MVSGSVWCHFEELSWSVGSLRGKAVFESQKKIGEKFFQNVVPSKYKLIKSISYLISHMHCRLG